ncbi:hypothetical protein [Ornithinibacillus scapharcae]|uniref:hypothetical protein n=1 Tax=Ornithinibacillus scapharcae TaxID=1147159 RepID=UPI000225BE27|nr:hypothetical protein [Ornithinibacillus scapharcae]
MAKLLPFLNIIAVLFSIIMQYYITKNNNWSNRKKYIISIGMFLLILILNIFIHIILGYLPVAPVSGIIFFVLISWAVMVSLIAGVLQIITAVVVWLYQRRTEKQ